MGNSYLRHYFSHGCSFGLVVLTSSCSCCRCRYNHVKESSTLPWIPWKKQLLSTVNNSRWLSTKHNTYELQWLIAIRKTVCPPECDWSIYLKFSIVLMDLLNMGEMGMGSSIGKMALRNLNVAWSTYMQFRFQLIHSARWPGIFIWNGYD